MKDWLTMLTDATQMFLFLALDCVLKVMRI